MDDFFNLKLKDGELISDYASRSDCIMNAVSSYQLPDMMCIIKVLDGLSSEFDAFKHSIHAIVSAMTWKQFMIKLLTLVEVPSKLERSEVLPQIPHDNENVTSVRDSDAVAMVTTSVVDSPVGKEIDPPGPTSDVIDPCTLVMGPPARCSELTYPDEVDDIEATVTTLCPTVPDVVIHDVHKKIIESKQLYVDEYPAEIHLASSPIDISQDTPNPCTPYLHMDYLDNSIHVVNEAQGVHPASSTDASYYVNDIKTPSLGHPSYDVLLKPSVDVSVNSIENSSAGAEPFPPDAPPLHSPGHSTSRDSNLVVNSNNCITRIKGTNGIVSLSNNTKCAALRPPDMDHVLNALTDLLYCTQYFIFLTAMWRSRKTILDGVTSTTNNVVLTSQLATVPFIY